MLLAALAVPALSALIAACGDDQELTDATTAGTAGSGDAPTTTTATVAGIDHPTGADDAVFRLAYVGGFTTADVAFTGGLTMLVTGDGRLITPAPTTLQYPGSLLPPLNERTISEAGVQALLQKAKTAGLLAPAPDYSAELMVADAPDTLLVISANGTTYTHQAPAIGFEEPDESDARKALRTFTEQIADLATVVGDANLGPEAPLAPAAYRLRATPITAEELATIQDPAPEIVAWGIADQPLAAASECVVVTADAAGTTLSDATQLTFFTDADVTYRVAAVALLPGDTC